MCDLDVKDNLAPGNAKAVDIKSDVLWALVNVRVLEYDQMREKEQNDALKMR